MQPAVHRQVAPPPVGIAGEGDGPARIDAADDVGPGPDRRFQRGFGKVLPLPLGFFQDRAQAHQHRKLAVGRVEGQPQAAGAGLFHLGDLRPCPGIARMALGPERLIGPHHVLDRDGRAVRKGSFGAQRELDPGAVRVGLDAFGKKAVKAERLVDGPEHQRLGDEVADRPDGVSLEDPGLQRIETAWFRQANRPTLRRVRVGVGKRGEAVGKGRFSNHCNGMPGLGGACQRHRCNSCKRHCHHAQHTQDRGFVRILEDSRHRLPARRPVRPGSLPTTVTNPRRAGKLEPWTHSPEGVYRMHCSIGFLPV